MTGRLLVAFAFILTFFIAIVIRLFYWQVVKAEELATLGKLQYGTLISVAAKRGEIKTSDGFAIATNRLSYMVFANPKEVKNKKETIENLSNYLQVDPASVSASLALDKFWVPIRSGVDSKTKEVLQKKNLPGVGFEEQTTRFYPEGSLAAHLTGFVGKNDAGEPKGYFGLEGYYDRQLAGKSGLAIQIHDAFGRPILSRASDEAGAIDGRSLTLHIDRSIQFIAEKKLEKGVEQFGAAGGMVGIIDPKTGSVLAMASFPSYDQGDYANYSDSLYKDPFISNVYEPGSTFKSLVMSAGFEASVVKPDTTCTICSGPVSIGGYEIRTWNNKYYKDINMIDVIRQSDNIGMVFVSKSLGLEKMIDFLGKFGIGEPTGIDLQGEVSPSIKDKNQWYPIDLTTVSFGQGISVTPIELLTAFSAIANEGRRMEPHVVDKIETADGQTITISPRILGTPISSKTAKVMTEVLVNAVNKGEAQFARLKGYRIAGKTGTAQIPIAGHYDPNKTIASFIGFAPADDPKFAMLVVVDRPTTSIYGAETAAPIFFDIARDILAYYQVPPTE